MNLKEFEQCKKNIIDNATTIVKLGSNILSNLDSIVENARKLQPPKPSTCNTCRYLMVRTVYEDRCEAWDKDDRAISEMAGEDICDPEDFGCNKHSDYGDVSV